MIYTDFKGKQLSLLGFGAMRMPLTAEGTVDEAQVTEMLRRALDAGMNYIDTAWPYHDGESENVLGRVLKHFPRESYYLADKYPGHQVSSSYDPAAIFEKQLEKCGVDYFDFYLLHNLNESSVAVYTDPKWGIIDYFKEQKRLGRIKHLGFSCHCSPDTLTAFLDAYGDAMEFCQIQLNWLDWTLQDAKAKYELLTGRSVPVWVMEPVRGGKLVNLPEQDREDLSALHPDWSVPSWCFRFLQGLPGVQMILSGMSNMEQIEDNLNTFAVRAPLNEAETDTLLDIAEGLKKSVPCTACRYCVAGCPMGLDIPGLISIYNDMRFAVSANHAIRMEGIPAEKWPSACIACGKCTKSCPQSIDIPAVMKAFAAEAVKLPSWAEICRKREEAERAKAAAE